MPITSDILLILIVLITIFGSFYNKINYENTCYYYHNIAILTLFPLACDTILDLLRNFTKNAHEH